MPFTTRSTLVAWVIPQILLSDPAGRLEISSAGRTGGRGRNLPDRRTHYAQSRGGSGNASPELIIAGDPLRSLLAGISRRLVLEVTEHAPIADYPAFRAAMDALGPKVEFAVDDTGTGFASLRHIVELRPAFVKLDRSLIAGLEADHARQAMIVGLCHFAQVTGCRLIVEGIETASELTLLRALAIDLGQGYLLGRPLPVDAA
jgi:EAL domain-containing protein (putative c-di-GMP-specific phosphodiesterase class I)